MGMRYPDQVGVHRLCVSVVVVVVLLLLLLLFLGPLPRHMEVPGLGVESEL